MSWSNSKPSAFISGKVLYMCLCESMCDLETKCSSCSNIEPILNDCKALCPRLRTQFIEERKLRINTDSEKIQLKIVQ